MIIEPHVEHYEVEDIKPATYGLAGKIALVGAFPSRTFKLGIFTDVSEAKDALKGEFKVPGDISIANASRTVVPTEYTAFYCLDHIFSRNRQSNGVESVLVVNTNYFPDSLVTASTNELLASALQELVDENFDILTIAEVIPIVTEITVEGDTTTILNPILTTLKTFYNQMKSNDHMFGIITGFDVTGAKTQGSNVNFLEEFKNLFKGLNYTAIYKAVSTPVKFIGGENSLNLAQSGCWHAAFTAGRPVNKSETHKEYEGVIGEISKERFSLREIITYEDLVRNGFHTTKYKDRLTQKTECLNNITPAGYDMKIERVKNYMLKRIALSPLLGEDNVGSTKDAIIGMLETEKKNAIKAEYLIDMEYSIIPMTTDTSKIKLKFYIPDIYRVFIVETSVRISMAEGA